MMKKMPYLISLLAGVLLFSASATAQEPAQAELPPVQLDGQLDGQSLFQTNCAVCHASADADSRTPTVAELAGRSPQEIVQSLTDGAMRYQGYALSGEERRAIAMFVTGRSFETGMMHEAIGKCEQSPVLQAPFAGPHWNGWGPDSRNTHAQSAEMAGLTEQDIPKLRLQWAFGFPDTSSAWSQPTVVGGRIFVGSQSAYVYSLDAKTGCTHWTYAARGGVRSAISVGEMHAADGPDTTTFAVYFADMRGNVYALDADTGEELWQVSVEEHPLVRLTGSPTLHEGRLYVPVSSYEESQGASPGYACCTFRGSVVALDAASGVMLWQRYTIDEVPTMRSRPDGGRYFGPAGGAIWSSPSIDVKRNRLYVSVGNNYTEPQKTTTNAVLALDLDSGEIIWSMQTEPDDIFITGCRNSDSAACPEEVGPDYDFGTAPLITTSRSGKDLIIVGQKSGVGFAMDPDDSGKVVWQYRAGLGSAQGGIQWGTAADAEKAYFPVSDLFREIPGGLHAVDLLTGERSWYTPPAELVCGALSRSCNGAQSAAITVIPGVVFSGAVDGAMRAYSSATGEILWTFDTNRSFATVNGIEATGGSIVGPGPVVVDGMLFFNAGYGAFGSMPGNVLLAFTVE
jgi:polyvinyl alcohol dehydrogenase (cytochrome)